MAVLAISLAVTLVLSVAVSEQAWGAPLGAVTNITQCKTATETTITLCWTNPSGATHATTGVKSFFIENITETCSGSGQSFSCSFSTTYRAALTGGVGEAGTNQTGGTGSNVNIVNFTGLSAGQLFKFKIYPNNAHGNGTASSVFTAGTLLGANTDYSSRPTQSFANGTTFGSGTNFAANQDFGNFQNFGANQVFGAGTGFAADQTFNGTQDFSAASIKFDSGTQFDQKQDFGAGANFTGATTFEGANTFGANAVFGHGATFEGEANVFAAGANFTGFANFEPNQVFGSGTEFSADQYFNDTQDFSAGSIKFESNAQFDTVQTFGDSANFTGRALFTGANTFGAAAVFGKDTNFPAGQTFGQGANFTGTAIFGSTQTFPAAAEFAAGQEFTAGSTYTFDDNALFRSGTDFGAARVFDVGTMFESTMTFVGTNTFDKGTVFGDGQAFSAAQTFAKNMNFGANTDFTGATQTFKAGTTFETGVQFAVDQVIPVGTVPPSGLMLEAFTCTDAACTPPAGSVLSPGEFLPIGTDPEEILSAVSASDPTVTIPGLGFIMNFTTVSGNGSASIDPIGPGLLPDSDPALRNTSSSSSSITVGTGSYDTIGTALDIQSGTATISGDITITMPYDESSITDGVIESDLSVLHYEGGKWIEENNCTVNTIANTISCTVDSLSPFTIGSSVSPKTGGGGNCDINAFGPGKSLALYEINWDILEANKVTVIASSTCGPIDMQVFSQQSIGVGGLSMVQPYVADNKIVLNAPLNIGLSDSFRITLENDWNSFEQTIYPELQGSSGTILLDFQEAHYDDVKLFIDEEPQQVAVPSSEVFNDQEPQAIIDAEPQLPTNLEPQLPTNLEPQLTTEQKSGSSLMCGEGTILIGETCQVQDKEQMSFLDWLFSLFF